MLDARDAARLVICAAHPLRALPPVQQHGALLRAQTPADGTEVQRQREDRHRRNGGEVLLSHSAGSFFFLFYSGTAADLIFPRFLTSGAGECEAEPSSHLRHHRQAAVAGAASEVETIGSTGGEPHTLK